MDESRIESLVRENAALKRTVESLMDVSEARQAGKKLGTSFRLFGENLALQHLVDEKTVALRKTLEELGHAQAQLLHGQKLEAVGQLAAGVAHEINTPMQYIGDNLQFLRKAFTKVASFTEAVEAVIADESVDPATAAALRTALKRSKLTAIKARAPKSVESALEGVETVSRIVSAMKEFSHPGSDDMSPTQLNELIQTTSTVCRNEWKYVADLDLGLEAGLPEVMAHGSELNQVLLNMIVNASHAIGDSRDVSKDGKGTIAISTASEGGSVVLRIRDSGCGMPAAVAARIFEPFYTTKEVGRGTGQGLAISHQIVSKHQGTIDVHTEVGVGTCFEIRIPAVGAAEEVA